MSRLLEPRPIAPVMEPTLTYDDQKPIIEILPDDTPRKSVSDTPRKSVSDTPRKSVSSAKTKSVSSTKTKSVSSRTPRHDTPVSDTPRKSVSSDVSSQHEKTVSWLKANPNRGGLSYRKAASALDVSIATIQRAEKELQ